MAFYGIVPEGAGGHLITIEAQVNYDAPTQDDALDIRLLGLPQAALKRGLLRWQIAMKNCNLSFPGHEVIINLAPANMQIPDTTLEASIVAILGVLGQTVCEPEEAIKENDKIEDLDNMLEEIRSCNVKKRKRLQNVLASNWVIIGELRACA